MTEVISREMQNTPRTIVFYDGSCGLCSREIRHYANLDRARRIEWIDISRDHNLLNDLGVSVDQAMRRLHVLDHGGVLHDGATAFVSIWAELPYFRVLARLVRLLRMTPLLELAYAPFAAWRYKRRMRSLACSAQ